MIRTFKYRIPKSSPTLDPVKDKVIALYLSGASTMVVGAAFGVTDGCVRQFLVRHDVPRRAGHERMVSLSKTAESRSRKRAARVGMPSPALGKRWRLAKRKYCPNTIGDKNPSWKGGVTPINFKIRNSPEYRAWREAVFARDDWTCQTCGSRSRKGCRVRIHADHIKPFSQFPELRFDLTNGRTLCKPCHQLTPTYGVNLQYLEAQPSGANVGLPCVA